MSENAERPRNSRLELVRIICMFLIICRHYCTQANWVELLTLENWSWRTLFIQLVGFGGSGAINVYLLISGYFMVQSKINWKR